MKVFDGLGEASEPARGIPEKRPHACAEPKAKPAGGGATLDAASVAITVNRGFQLTVTAAFRRGATGRVHSRPSG